jgi:ElaB/YqjD/DUF883 family membrane-anchored ribosome-binding protein
MLNTNTHQGDELMKTTVKNPAVNVSPETQEEFEQAKKAALEAYSSFVEAKEHLKTAAHNAGVDFRESANEQFHETVEKLTERKRQVLDDTSEYIRENPVMSAGLAFLGGILFSRLLK